MKYRMEDDYSTGLVAINKAYSGACFITNSEAWFKTKFASFTQDASRSLSLYSAESWPKTPFTYYYKIYSSLAQFSLTIAAITQLLKIHYIYQKQHERTGKYIRRLYIAQGWRQSIKPALGHALSNNLQHPSKSSAVQCSNYEKHKISSFLFLQANILPWFLSSQNHENITL